MRIDRPAPAPHPVSGAGVAWRPELAWAAELSLDERTLSDLRAVNAFLRDGGGERPVVPLRERSLQLFGHEKRLEALIGGQLFFPDRLTLERLRCEEIHPPFVFETIGAAPGVLVVENHHTFVSLCRKLPREGSVGVVVYGAGAHFKGSVTYLADLPIRPRRVLSSVISISTASTSRFMQASLPREQACPQSSPLPCSMSFCSPKVDRRRPITHRRGIGCAS